MKWIFRCFLLLLLAFISVRTASDCICDFVSAVHCCRCSSRHHSQRGVVLFNFDIGRLPTAAFALPPFRQNALTRCNTSHSADSQTIDGIRFLHSTWWKNKQKWEFHVANLTIIVRLNCGCEQKYIQFFVQLCAIAKSSHESSSHISWIANCIIYNGELFPVRLCVCVPKDETLRKHIIKINNVRKVLHLQHGFGSSSTSTLSIRALVASFCFSSTKT